jgi:hypothetical protein
MHTETQKRSNDVYSKTRKLNNLFSVAGAGEKEGRRREEGKSLFQVIKESEAVSGLREEITCCLPWLCAGLSFFGFSSTRKKRKKDKTKKRQRRRKTSH